MNSLHLSVILIERRYVPVILLFNVWANQRRLQHVDYEVRAGLSTTYAEKGWVADDIHSESGSRTLDYACKFLCT